MEEGDVKSGPLTIVTGQLSVANLSLYMFIDSGITHSFILRKAANILEGTRIELTHPFITAIPAADMYESMYWYKNLPICIKHNILYANLIIIEMSDYDVILGMDWFSTHHALIDYQKK